jgi:hypothetical protein
LLVFNPRNSALCLRLKTHSGLAGNQNLPFMYGHELKCIKQINRKLTQIDINIIFKFVFIRVHSWFDLIADGH